jgi:dephospho-CoA kinase
MHVIGLTGGIGSGKSTVADVLQQQGATVVSADLTGHEVYQPGRPAWQEIVDAFGRDVVAPDGTIDRQKLGAIVFSDPKELKRLNAITHPRMKGMMREKLQALRQQGVTVALLEAALLLDAGWDDLVDEIWVTVAPEQVAARRTAERSGISEAQARERIRAQMPNEERKKRANVVIETDCSMEETRSRAVGEWDKMQKRQASGSAAPNV